MLFKNIIKSIKVLFLLLIIFVALKNKLLLAYQTGGDYDIHIKAITSFLENENPYYATIESYKNLNNDPGNKGFAYLPGFLYSNGGLYLTHLSLQKIFPCNDFNKISYCIPFYVLWKIPTLVSDLSIGLLIFYILQKKNSYAAFFGIILWFFNPFFVYKRDFIPLDPVPIFFMFISLYYLKKDSYLSGALYALAVALKTFPLFILPVMILKSKSKTRFLVASSIVGLVLSFPFLRTMDDFLAYINGALLVHDTRFMQGRPFLFYISYYYDIELFRIVSLKLYTFLAKYSGWIFILLVHFLNEGLWIKVRSLFVKNKRSYTKKSTLLTTINEPYILSSASFGLFYMFTPVLNRTYLLWFLPIFIVASFNLFFKKIDKPILYYIVLISYWIFYYWYLVQWKDGFHIWHP